MGLKDTKTVQKNAGFRAIVIIKNTNEKSHNPPVIHKGGYRKIFLAKGQCITIGNKFYLVLVNSKY